MHLKRTAMQSYALPLYRTLLTMSFSTEGPAFEPGGDCAIRLRVDWHALKVEELHLTYLK
jgi:hypothetical protein